MIILACEGGGRGGGQPKCHVTFLGNLKDIFKQNLSLKSNVLKNITSHRGRGVGVGYNITKCHMEEGGDLKSPKKV